MAFGIWQIQNDFESQRKTIGKYIAEFDIMKEKTEILKKSLDTKRKSLLEVHANLKAAGSMAKHRWDVITAEIHFKSVQDAVKRVLDACEEFLHYWRSLD